MISCTRRVTASNVAGLKSTVHNQSLAPNQELYSIAPYGNARRRIHTGCVVLALHCTAVLRGAASGVNEA